MTLPVWPTALRTDGAAGVTGSPQTNIAAFSPEVGPPINRRRASVITRTYSVSMNMLTLAEYEAFQTFFHDTLVDGTLPFRRTHPMTGEWHKCRFAGSGERMYEETRVNADAFALRFSLMTMNRITIPGAFTAGMWSIAPGDTIAAVTINSLPISGGEPITDIERQLDSGAWVSTGGIVSFNITGLTNSQTYDVRLRAVNVIGAGAQSDMKQVTPAV